MKNFKLTGILFAAMCLLVACKKTTATVEGLIDGYDGTSMLFCKVVAGEVDTILVDSNGAFTHIINLTDNKEVTYTYMGAKRRVANIFVTPGSKINLQLKPLVEIEEMPLYCTYELTGDNEKENRYLRQYELGFSNRYIWNYAKAAESGSFKAWQEFVEESYETLRAVLLKCDNKEFIKKRMNMLEYDRRSVPFWYVWGNKEVNDAPYDSDPDFVAYTQTIDLNDLDNSDRRPLTDHYLRWYILSHPDSSKTGIAYYFDLIEEKITNPEVKNMLAKNRVNNELIFGTPEEVKATYAEFIAMSTNEEDKAEITPKYEKIKRLSAGEVAPDFIMQDPEGYVVNLTDLRGKILYIDVWASWCGPCKAEAPYFKKMYDKFKNNDEIEFFAVSIDNEPDDWMEFISKADHPYRQFIAPNGTESELCTTYNITGIPRFMMIDKEGKIIAANAPRPSSDGVVDFIQTQLSKI